VIGLREEKGITGIIGLGYVGLPLLFVYPKGK